MVARSQCPVRAIPQTPNNSFKPRPLRGSTCAVSCTTPPSRYASRLNSGVRQRTKSFFCAFPQSGRPRFSKFFWPLSHLSHDFGDIRSKVLAWGTVSGDWLRMFKHRPPTSAGLHHVTTVSRLVRLSPCQGFSDYPALPN